MVKGTLKRKNKDIKPMKGSVLFNEMSLATFFQSQKCLMLIRQCSVQPWNIFYFHSAITGN